MDQSHSTLTILISVGSVFAVPPSPLRYYFFKTEKMWGGGIHPTPRSPFAHTARSFPARKKPTLYLLVRDGFAAPCSEQQIQYCTCNIGYNYIRGGKKINQHGHPMQSVATTTKKVLPHGEYLRPSVPSSPSRPPPSPVSSQPLSTTHAHRRVHAKYSWRPHLDDVKTHLRRVPVGRAVVSRPGVALQRLLQVSSAQVAATQIVAAAAAAAAFSQQQTAAAAAARDEEVSLICRQQYRRQHKRSSAVHMRIQQGGGWKAQNSRPWCSRTAMPPRKGGVPRSPTHCSFHRHFFFL